MHKAQGFGFMVLFFRNISGFCASYILAGGHEVQTGFVSIVINAGTGSLICWKRLKKGFGTFGFAAV